MQAIPKETFRFILPSQKRFSNITVVNPTG